MTRPLLPLRAATAIAMSFIFFVACSKDSGDDDTPDTPDCSVVTVSAVTTPTAGCSSSGTITATATGGSGFTYKLNSDAFQSSNVFENIIAGDHTITVKTANGCSITATVKVLTTDSGPLFNTVKSLIETHCRSCHSGSSANGNMDFSVECNIVSAKERIKARAVDGNPSFMPQGGEMAQADKDKITAWINAGGRQSD